jgi:DHA2 family metal-tetracycline-proton antiporter-like MFS transporter
MNARLANPDSLLKSRATQSQDRPMPATQNRQPLVRWLSFLIFFAVLNETVFNVSVPTIAAQFDLTAATVSWVMTIFMGFFGIGSVIYGRLADLYSLRRLIEFGTCLYCAASVFGFIVQDSYALVIVARAVQAMGASAIPALCFVCIARYVPIEGRGKVFGFITSVVSVSIGIGPVLGGFVSGQLHWAILFLMPLPTLVALPYLRRELPVEPSRPGRVDFIGAILVALVVGLLVLYLNFMQQVYLLGLVVVAVTLALWLRFAPAPFIDPALFRNIRFRNGVFVGMTLFSVVFGVFFLVPLMLSQVHELSTDQIGMLLFPGAISAVWFGPYAGALADKKGNAFVVGIGVLLLAGSMAGMALLLGFTFWVVMFAMLGNYIGFTMFQTAMVNSVSQTLAPEQSGIGMGIFNLISIVAGALGTTLVGRILDGQWLDSGLISLSRNLQGFAYSDILLVLTLVVLASGWVFRVTFKGVPVQSGGAVHGH